MGRQRKRVWKPRRKKEGNTLESGAAGRAVFQVPVRSWRVGSTRSSAKTHHRVCIFSETLCQSPVRISESEHIGRVWIRESWQAECPRVTITRGRGDRSSPSLQAVRPRPPQGPWPGPRVRGRRRPCVRPSPQGAGVRGPGPSPGAGLPVVLRAYVRASQPAPPPREGQEGVSARARAGLSWTGGSRRAVWADERRRVRGRGAWGWFHAGWGGPRASRRRWQAEVDGGPTTGEERIVWVVVMQAGD